MPIYDREHKNYQRETWAGFNIIIFGLAAILLLCTLFSLIWYDEDTPVLLFKILATVFIMGLVSLIAYCCVYRVISFS